MFKIKLLFIALLIPVVLLACSRAIPAPQPLPSPQPLPTRQQTPGPVAAWTVSMQLSGGFAGLSRSIVISNDGMATARDERSGKTVKKQLTPDEFAQINNLVKSATLNPSSGSPAVCVDCFVYNIQVNSGGGKSTAQFDDISLPNSGMAPLVNYLRDLMSKMLAGG